MKTLEAELVSLRGVLHAAVTADLRRAARRRRLAQLVVVPVLALSGTAAAAALAPWWNDPAPAPVQRTFDETIERFNRPGSVDPRHGPWLPDGTRLTTWARDGEHVLYGRTSSTGQWCVVQEGPLGPEGGRCGYPSDRPAPGAVRFDSVGGASDPAANAASGEVAGTAARTVTVTVIDSGRSFTVPVGRYGFFIAELGDSTGAPDLGPTERDAPQAPHLEVAARDADGNVVARGDSKNP